MISCLTITRAARLHLLHRAVADFARQVHRDCELLIVHDAGPAFGLELDAMARAHPHSTIRTCAAATGSTLGDLRNLAVSEACGDFVCQWDDDDRYHPLRLQLQWEALVRDNADCCFLSDQLHFFPARRELYWDDWDAEPYPMNLVQGTMLVRKEGLPRYRSLARGEDTSLALELMRSGRRIARLRDHGWAYVYTYHGGNVWDEGHHLAISRLKHLRPARLWAREAKLRARLAEYDPPIGPVQMPCGNESLAIG